jgi:hypothetical protein
MIVQNVDESAPYFERRPKNARVVAIRKDSPPPPETPIQRASKTHAEALHRARKRALSVCLDDEMQMVRLNGKLRETHP